MPCIHNQSINCSVEDCGSCGWNQAVTDQRKKRNRQKQSINIAVSKKMRDYQAAFSLGCCAKVSEESGGKLKRDVLEQIAKGGSPRLPREEWELLNQTLDRLLGKEAGRIG